MSVCWLIGRSVINSQQGREITFLCACRSTCFWPINPCFSSESVKTEWWRKLVELTGQERGHSPAGASINITYFDTNTNFEHVSIFKIYTIIHTYVCLYLESIFQSGVLYQLLLFYLFFKLVILRFIAFLMSDKCNRNTCMYIHLLWVLYFIHRKTCPIFNS